MNIPRHSDERSQDGYTPMAVTVAALAGGRSRRMGQDKLRLVIDGEPLLRRTLRRLEPLSPYRLVVGPPALADAAPSPTLFIADRREEAGPLAGLESALLAAQTPLVFVVAGDMPFVSLGVATAQVALAEREPTADAVAIRGAQGWEPLHTVYRRSCLPLVSARLDAGERSLRGLLHLLRVIEMPEDLLRRLDPQGLATFNANTPLEWERALRLAAERDGAL